MNQRLSIESSKLHKGRYAWLARIPFVIAAAAGAAAIIGLKLHGSSQGQITIVACALIVEYAILVSGILKLRLREDQLADNCYYLGFLYTLISLAWALYEFRDGTGIDSIIANFGIALFSTITGIVLRVFINQSRRDVLETEQDARMELESAVVRMRGTIDDAVLSLSSFCRVVQQTAAEQIGLVAGEATKALEQSVVRVGNVSSDAISKIDEAFSEFRSHASTLTAAGGETAKAVKALLSRIDKIEAPSDLVTRRLEPALATVEEAANRLSKRLKSDEDLVRTYNESVAVLQQTLHATSTRLEATLSELEAVGNTAGGFTATAESAVRRVADLVTMSEAILAQQGALAEGAGGVTNRLVTELRTHNDTLLSEINRSRQLVSQMSNALVDLAEHVTKKVSEHAR